MSQSPCNAKHTPGPWSVEAGLDGAHIIRVKTVSKTESNVIARDALPHNARLIAAAPELLEALHAAIPYLDDASSSVLRRVHDAIAKAEGVDHV